MNKPKPDWRNSVVALAHAACASLTEPIAARHVEIINDAMNELTRKAEAPDDIVAIAQGLAGTDITPLRVHGQEIGEIHNNHTRLAASLQKHVDRYARRALRCAESGHALLAVGLVRLARLKARESNFNILLSKALLREIERITDEKPIESGPAAKPAHAGS